jgi:hypothetical protein
MNMPIDITDQYVRVRVKEPRLFHAESFRTQDFGRKGWSKRIGGILKEGNRWETQSYLVSRHGLERKDKRTIELLRQIEQKHNINLGKVKKIFNVS